MNNVDKLIQKTQFITKATICHTCLYTNQIMLSITLFIFKKITSVFIFPFLAIRLQDI